MKNILITGANRGLGLEFTRRYLEDGCHVTALVRSSSSELLAMRADANLDIYEGDLCDDQFLSSLPGLINIDNLDILINNAGIMGDGSFARHGRHSQDLGSFDRDEWRRVFEINLFTPMHLTSTLADRLREGSLVVTLSSIMGSISGKNFGGWYAYRASKAAVNCMMKSMSIELTDRGVICLALHPGWVRTDMGGPNADIDEATSVSGMRQVIEQAGPQDSGKYFGYDGKELAY